MTTAEFAGVPVSQAALGFDLRSIADLVEKSAIISYRGNDECNSGRGKPAKKFEGT
jgi:hypothetical protein